jgi:hypothetical protein
MSRHQREFASAYPSGLRLACGPRMEQALLGFFSDASNPAVTKNARQSGDGPLNTYPELRCCHHAQPSNQRAHSNRATSCRTQKVETVVDVRDQCLRLQIGAVPSGQQGCCPLRRASAWMAFTAYEHENQADLARIEPQGRHVPHAATTTWSYSCSSGPVDGSSPRYQVTAAHVGSRSPNRVFSAARCCSSTRSRSSKIMTEYARCSKLGAGCPSATDGDASTATSSTKCDSRETTTVHLPSELRSTSAIRRSVSVPSHPVAAADRPCARCAATERVTSLWGK